MKIDIMGVIWQVTFASAHDPVLCINNTECRGATWYDMQRIFIAEDVPAECALGVIRHEVTHAYLASTQIKLPETFDEEYICDFIAVYGPMIVKTSEYVFDAMYMRGE